MQTATVDFADKAATLKALSLSLETEYDQNTRATWLTLNALHCAYGSLAGAANKLENAPQGSENFGNLISTVADEIATVESVLSSIDIERVKTDATYAGSQLERASIGRRSAEAVDQLGGYIAKAATAAKSVEQAAHHRTAFVAAPKKRVAVVKGHFTHTKGGSPVRFHTGWHCSIDREMESGGMLIGAGDWAVPFTADEITRLFDIVEA